MVDKNPEMEKIQEDRSLSNKDMRKVGRIDFPEITRLESKPSNKLSLLELAIYQDRIPILINFSASKSWFQGGLLCPLSPRIEHGVVVAILVVLRQIVCFQLTRYFPYTWSP